MSRYAEILDAGQSLWLDDIRREWLESGELKRRIDSGQIRGMTSNPSIFEKAIAESDFYTGSLRPLAQAGWKSDAILDALMFDDIRAAADLFRPLYESTSGGDGFVSIEVKPSLADDTQATVLEARRLWSSLNRPNIMIKIPGTAAGVPAIQQAISEGINVNVTLIFSLTRYAEVIEAYLSGLEERNRRGAPIDHIASVASFFVSRVDTAVDGRLEAIVRSEVPEAQRAAALRGTAAIANAKLAYAQFRAAFESERFRRLQTQGARYQRPLWASTSTKNPAYPDTYYVDGLIGPDTVNTVPVTTLEAFGDHGSVAETLTQGLSDARSRLAAIEGLHIKMSEVTDELERQGVAKFAEAFNSLTKTVERRARTLAREVDVLRPRLGSTLEKLDADDVPRRVWSGDAALWPGDAGGWLGWLELPRDGGRRVDELVEAARALTAGHERGVLLGMGGSSLAPSLLRSWAEPESGIPVTVLDTVEPGAVRAASRGPRPLVFVASKSGKTVEPLTLLEHFWSKAGRNADKANHFAAITDPGTPLEVLARDRHFKRIISSPPDVGGRYSALSVFGLVPAAAAGVDIRALLEGGSRMARQCGPNVDAPRNPGAFLGAVLAAAWEEGRDKVTLVADPDLEAFLPWVEQLLAESSGKHGKGIVPVVGEPPGSAGHYRQDRLIVYLRRGGALDRKVERWVRARIPVAILEVQPGVRGVGGEFFRWEMATAIACHGIGVNAFDQPDVESAKVAARESLAAGGAPVAGDEETEWKLEGPDGMTAPPSDLVDALRPVAESLRPGDAFALLLFVPENPAARRAALKMRRAVRDKLGNATVVGFGPRYLHSTGQLFKGGSDHLVALYLDARPGRDLTVAGVEHSLGELMHAQAVGDFKAMKARGRRAYFLSLESSKVVAAVARAFVEAVGSVPAPAGR